MWTFLSWLTVCGTAIYLWNQVKDAVFARVSAINVAAATNNAFVVAQTANLQHALSRETSPRPRVEPVPMELYEYAVREAGGESWAEEDIIAEALERKEKLGSWDKVMATYET